VRWWSGAIADVLMLAACTDAGGDVRLPPRDVRFDYQLGGAYPAAEDVGVVVRDRTDAPDPDRYSVCYVNAFQAQPGADDVPERLLHDADGARVEDGVSVQRRDLPVGMPGSAGYVARWCER
jgi:hypothetical protein